LSPSSVTELSETKDAEFEVPEVPAAASPPFSAFSYEPPVQYLPGNPIQIGLQLFDEYGLAKYTEGLDFSSIGDLGDASAGTETLDENDDVTFEFADWCHV
jgi:hypothetical protein